MKLSNIKQRKGLILLVGVLLGILFMNTASAGVYSIQIRMTGIRLCQDGDGQFGGQGELYWDDPSESVYLGKYEDYPITPCNEESFYETYTVYSGSPVASIDFQLKDYDGAYSQPYQNLWDGQIETTQVTGWVSGWSDGSDTGNRNIGSGVTIDNHDVAYAYDTPYGVPTYTYNTIHFEVRVQYYPYI